MLFTLHTKREERKTIIFFELHTRRFSSDKCNMNSYLSKLEFSFNLSHLEEVKKNVQKIGKENQEKIDDRFFVFFLKKGENIFCFQQKLKNCLWEKRSRLKHKNTRH